LSNWRRSHRWDADLDTERWALEEERACVHGNANVLTRNHSTSRLSQGPSGNGVRRRGDMQKPAAARRGGSHRCRCGRARASEHIPSHAFCSRHADATTG
jgi:hypothetical protein